MKCHFNFIKANYLFQLALWLFQCIQSVDTSNENYKLYFVSHQKPQKIDFVCGIPIHLDDNIVMKIGRYRYARGVKNCVLGTSRFKIDLDGGDGWVCGA